MHVRLHDFQLHKRSDQYVDVEQHALRLYYDIFMRQRESNPMSSARQAVWLTTVLHAAQRQKCSLYIWQIFTIPAVWKKHNNGMTNVKRTFDPRH
ncbi:hypothetical protein T01_12623 [Trichinella spiralis]|uniref:Uncharacterized protein n=1 Tax=Trichinella spiralis TaxID=6334 RepID=A0A0V1BPQ8_TRISP|nr:hypothetical protein T01_12623 [Trichinella spiralis]